MTTSALLIGVRRTGPDGFPNNQSKYVLVIQKPTTQRTLTVLIVTLEENMKKVHPAGETTLTKTYNKHGKRTCFYTTERQQLNDGHHKHRWDYTT